MLAYSSTHKHTHAKHSRVLKWQSESPKSPDCGILSNISNIIIKKNKTNTNKLKQVEVAVHLLGPLNDEPAE